MLKMKNYTVEQLQEMLQEVNSWDGSLEYYEYWDMEQLDDLFHGVKPTEILRMAHFGDFNWNDDYFTVNAYGNLESINDMEYYKLLEDIQEEIIEHYEELVENGEIEDLF